MKYKIYQLHDLHNCDYAFANKFKEAKEKGFDINDYDVVYEGNIEPEDEREDLTVFDYLENLFYIFNMEHPKDFHGHSLSTSDIVELDGKKYYVEGIGWTLIEQK